jgi:hypothetical protein
MTWLVGDYRYGSSIIAGQRFAIVKNGEIVERIRVIQKKGNPVIWQEGDPMTEQVIEIMEKASFEVAPQV